MAVFKFFFGVDKPRKNIEMTTTNAQLQAFAHNGGGKRKHATTADADILPGVFDCRKRA